MIFLITGTAGTGKTTVGKGLAEKLNLPFFDGDDFHPKVNIQKMSNGIPLQDEDRRGWLKAIRNRMELFIERNSSAVFTCSALKKSYRSVLMNGISDTIFFVYLYGDFELLQKRLQDRPGHYMKENMLLSQFKDLEVPEDGLQFDVSTPPEMIIQQIVHNMEGKWSLEN